MGLTLQRAARGTVTLLRDTLYPQTCVLCDTRVEEAHALCPTCWSDTTFIAGAACTLCGVSLPGATASPDDRCDECLTLARPWDDGRAVLAYAGGGRRMVLALKHGDRTELGAAAALWMHRRARDLLTAETVFVPVPIHRWRLLKRRYNQSALIAQGLARLTGGRFLPEALVRRRPTPGQDHRGVADRFQNLAQAIAPGPEAVAGRHVALIDDVMTSGATLAACADVLRAAGATRITVLILARVAKDR
ncbi:MAG: ComF family protein [Jannaschia sp.]